MKKFAFIVVCMLLVGAAVWYFMPREGGARDVLPADATAACVFEPAEFLMELGLTPKEIYESFMPYVGEGKELGVDFSKPIYAFTSESRLAGIALNVSDADQLIKNFSSLGFASEEQQGFRWVADQTRIGCLDGGKMLFCSGVSETGRDAFRDKMVKLMTQGRQDVPLLDKANAQKGVLRLSASLRDLPQMLNGKIENSEALSKAFLNVAFGIEKKRIRLSLSIEGEVWQGDALFSPIKGNLIDFEPEEPFAWICANMKGEELLPYLRKVPELRDALLALNMCVDADLMIKAISGDVSLAIPAAEKDFNFLLTASLANTDFLANSDSWQVARRGKSDFYVRGNETEVFFGVRDGKLYIASSEELANKACQKAEAEDFQEEAKGRYLSASLDAEKLVKTLSTGLTPTAIVLNIPQIREAVDALDRVSVTADSPQSLELSIETDKPVKEIVSNLWKMLK